MSDFDRNYAAARSGVGADRAVAIDAGLRAYMIRIYNYMAMGVALTGVVAWLTFQAAVETNAAGAIVGLTAFGQAIFSGPAVLVLFLGTLGLVFLISGAFLTAAGFKERASEAGGTAEALAWLSPPWDTVVAIGLILFGLYSLIEARYRVLADVPVEGLANKARSKLPI